MRPILFLIYSGRGYSWDHSRISFHRYSSAVAAIQLGTPTDCGRLGYSSARLVIEYSSALVTDGEAPAFAKMTAVETTPSECVMSYARAAESEDRSDGCNFDKGKSLHDDCISFDGHPYPYISQNQSVATRAARPGVLRLLDPIDRELLPRQVPFIHPPQQKHPHAQPAANPFRLPVTHQPPHQSITCRSFAHHPSFPTTTTSSSWRARWLDTPTYKHPKKFI